MKLKFTEFVSNITDEDLKELGAAVLSQTLSRVKCFLDGGTAVRDTEERGELFQNPWTDHSFTNLADDVGDHIEAIARTKERLPSIPALHERSVEVMRQLQAETQRKGQMQ